MGGASASDHRSRRAGASYCALLALAIWTTQASAQSGCEETLAAELVRLRGPHALAESERYRTTFSQDGEKLTATIRAADGSTRTLTGTDCHALASATAVALALLLDMEPAPEPAPEPPVEPSPSALTAGAGAGVVLGVPRDVAPVVLGELGFRRERWRVGAGVLWALPKREDFGPGDIRSALIAGTARVCLAHHHLALCSGAQLGALTMEARDYTRNEREHVFWGAIPLELALDYVWSSVGAELGLAALFPLQRHAFSIDGVGNAQREWPVQAAFVLRLFGVKNL